MCITTSRSVLIVQKLLIGSAIALSCAATAQAQEAAPQDEETRSSQDIVVIAGIAYRNRSDDTEPKLIYGDDYFQRFEPLTAGDALKRVPSVAFLSDVIESDGARLRGLDPGYTQILINGERVPGSQADRSFFLDRIPAELVKQVEIMRSSSARRTGDAVAGTLNIVLRDALTMDGGYVRAGALAFDDGKVKPAGGIYYGGQVGPGRLLFGANVQGRYNPKVKKSLRYTNSPENDSNFAVNAFDNREDQSDVRNGTDYAANASYAIDGATTRFELSGSYVRTERVENERSFEYNDLTATNGPVRTTSPGNLTVDNHNVNSITQESWSAAAKFSKEWSLGKTKARISFARFDDVQDEYENEIEFDRTNPRFTGDIMARTIRDDELAFSLEHAFPVSTGVDLVVGGFAQNKDRKTDLQEGRDRFNLTAANREGYDQFSRDPNEFVRGLAVLAPLPGGLNAITEERRDLFVLVEGKSGPIKFEAGLRWENTDLTIDDKTVPAINRTSYNFLLPSASVKFDLGQGRITASVAKTMRRPRFDYISPALLEGELGDNDQLGNPALKPETAWGGDVGYEHRLGRTGVVGVNVFYRSVTNLIEMANTGVEGSDGPGTFVFQPRNSGNGKVWGIEFDLSTDLGAVGLPHTGVFGNLALIDSEITDIFGTRRFNGQAEYVYNFGIIQDLPNLGVAFGATYRKQGNAFDRVIGEEVVTSYGADLELFIEKKFGTNFTVRAVGSNLLNSSKDEAFNKFNTVSDQVSRSFDEYELETETAGPVFQIVARYAF